MSQQSVRFHKELTRNFVNGIFWGMGSVIGATFILSLLLGILRQINFVPVVGDFAAKIVREVEAHRFTRDAPPQPLK